MKPIFKIGDTIIIEAMVIGIDETGDGIYEIKIDTDASGILVYLDDLECASELVHRMTKKEREATGYLNNIIREE